MFWFLIKPVEDPRRKEMNGNGYLLTLLFCTPGFLIVKASAGEEVEIGGGGGGDKVYLTINRSRIVTNDNNNHRFHY